MRYLQKRPLAVLLLAAVVALALGTWAAEKISANGKEITSGAFKGTKVTGTTIDIEFTPNEHCSKCSKIVFIQVVKRTGTKADGTKIPLKPSDFKNFPGSAEKDKVTIASEGKTLDYAVGEKDPYYNGDDEKQDKAHKPKEPDNPKKSKKQRQGYKESPGETAKMTDTPSTNPANWPAGITKITRDFETAAFCADGPDKGHYFGTIKWRYERSKGGTGSVTIQTASSVTGPPDRDYLILGEGGEIIGELHTYSLDADGQPSANFRHALTKWLDRYKFKLPGTPIGMLAPWPDDPMFGGSWIMAELPGLGIEDAFITASVPLDLPSDPWLEEYGLQPSGLSRMIEATALDGFEQLEFPFALPMTIVFHYEDEETWELQEETLGVGFYDPNEGRYTTEGLSILGRDLEQNLIMFSTWNLGLFTIVGFPDC